MAALMTTIFGYNRRRLPIGAMSNKFALSDIKDMLESGLISLLDSLENDLRRREADFIKL
tara:strand:- start:23 stop:202 length:180 start_codon:yes stop_codon:yes gene_type:complete